MTQTASPFSRRRGLASGLKLTALLLLVGCQQGGLGFPGSSTQKPISKQGETLPAAKPKLSAKVEGQRVGDGPVRVALLVPQTAPGGAGTVGKQLANAARLAVRDFGANRIHVVIKDTQGKAAQAALLAAQARNEGASIVLGPLFSANVSSASAVTKPANLPIIAFSSDIARASTGVYLLSFAPSADIFRTLDYGLSLGANRVVALLPEGAYGSLAERELRRVLDNAGGQVVSVVRYAKDNNSKITAARSVVLSLPNANAIYIPEGGQVPALMLRAIQKSGGALTGKQVLGSGQWGRANLSDRILEGAIFAGPDKQNFRGFARRYSATYGNQPTVTAALAYDAVSLTAELVKRNSNAPFSSQAIESRNGFNGATGLFRFRSGGKLQRRLVVNRVEGGKAVVASPAPSSFGRH